MYILCTYMYIHVCYLFLVYIHVCQRMYSKAPRADAVLKGIEIELMMRAFRCDYILLYKIFNSRVCTSFGAHDRANENT